MKNNTKIVNLGLILNLETNPKLEFGSELQSRGRRGVFL